MTKKILLPITFTLLSTVVSFAQLTLQNAFPNLTFSNPLFLTNAGDGTNRIFVVEQAGRIRVFDNSSSVTSTKVFLDITDRVTSGGERGLLGLTFHPDYENNGYFYVNYTYTSSGNLRTNISRFQVTSNPDSADKNSEFQILSYGQPFSNHNCGWLDFRPSDGYLYIGTGDGGSGGDPGNRAQNITEYLGKMLRIDVDGGTPYAIPPTNPFYDSTNTLIKKEIYAWGFRNPWRNCFDPVTDRFWVADVGQDLWEEIDIVEIGKNYGWRCYEGNHNYNTNGCNYPEYIYPVWEYSHGQSYSITGGYVYRGLGVPELTGKYIYADYGSSFVWSLEYNGINPPVNTLLLTATGSVTSFGQDEENELYITSFNGRIYRFTPTIVSTESHFQPGEYSIEQNYPNPFNPNTVISFHIPEESSVSIKVYNSLGKEVEVIENDIKQKGNYKKTWNAKGFASGVYFVKINAESLESGKNFKKIIKMMYLK